MRSLLLASALLLVSGCMVYPHGGYIRGGVAPVVVSPGAPPPAARLLSEREAVDVAGRWAASQGVQVDYVKHANLDGEGRWHVDLRGRGKEKAKVLVDARTGQILQGKVKAGHGKHGHDRDDDDED